MASKPDSALRRAFILTGFCNRENNRITPNSSDDKRENTATLLPPLQNLAFAYRS
jgi:hypothetical protein